MGHSKAIVALALAGSLLLPGLSGCAFLTLKLRSPGHHHKDFPDEVAQEYHCDKRPLPWFQFEGSELVPKRVKPGHEFAHRIVYVLCPDQPTGIVAGTLRTRVLFEGRTIVEETVPEKLRPGRWVLDSFVTMPENVEPGLYAMDVRFDSRRGKLEARVDFVVKSP